MGQKYLVCVPPCHALRHRHQRPGKQGCASGQDPVRPLERRSHVGTDGHHLAGPGHYHRAEHQGTDSHGAVCRLRDPKPPAGAGTDGGKLRTETSGGGAERIPPGGLSPVFRPAGDGRRDPSPAAQRPGDHRGRKRGRRDPFPEAESPEKRLPPQHHRAAAPGRGAGRQNPAGFTGAGRAGAAD